MDSKEFLQESLDYVSNSYFEFQKYQNNAFEILLFLKNICNENNIPFFLAFGTLLGAIRDNDIIPWDYDIDIWVPYSFKDRLISALSNNEMYSFIYSETCPNYSSSCLKVYNKDKTFTSIHVDVYFLIGLPSDSEKQIEFAKKIRKNCKFRKRKFRHLWFNPERDFFHKCLSVLNKLRTMWISEQVLCRKETKMFTKYAFDDSINCFSVGDPYGRIYKSSCFNSFEMVDVRGIPFPVPSGYKEILEKLYGEYNHYLPISNRYEEFYKMLSIIRKRDNNG